MRKIRTILVISFCLCFLLFVGCSQKVDKLSADNVKDKDTKSYYQNLGYVSIDYDDCFLVDGDLVYFSDGTVFAKNKTNIKINFNSDDFISYGTHFVNYKTSKILIGIEINGITYSPKTLETDGFDIKSETSIKPVLKNFKVYGIALVIDDPTLQDGDALHVHDDTLFKIQNLVYIKSKSGDLGQDEKTSDFESSVQFQLTKSDKNFNFSIEFEAVNLIFDCYAILKTDEDTFFLAELSKIDEEFYLNENSPLKINVKIITQ